MQRRLGPLIVVTDRHQAAAAGRDLVDVVAAAVDAGARTVLLREKDLHREEREVLASALANVLADTGGSVLVASSVALASAVGAVGVHLASIDPFPALDRALLVGRSCHSVEELRAAQAAGADYATVSPVWATGSKPGYGPALGLAGLTDAMAAVPELPIYALGGIEPERAGACRTAGAGVAVMGAVMHAADPGAVVRDLLDQLEGRRERQGA